MPQAQHLLTLGSLPAVVVYPVFNVGTIIVITAAGALFFHEKLSRNKKCALLLILASLLFIMAAVPPFSFIVKYSVSRLVMYWAVVWPA